MKITNNSHITHSMIPTHCLKYSVSILLIGLFWLGLFLTAYGQEKAVNSAQHPIGTKISPFTPTPNPVIASTIIMSGGMVTKAITPSLPRGTWWLSYFDDLGKYLMRIPGLSRLLTLGMATMSGIWVTSESLGITKSLSIHGDPPEHELSESLMPKALSQDNPLLEGAPDPDPNNNPKPLPIFPRDEHHSLLTREAAGSYTGQQAAKYHKRIHEIEAYTQKAIQQLYPIYLAMPEKDFAHRLSPHLGLTDYSHFDREQLLSDIVSHFSTVKTLLRSANGLREKYFFLAYIMGLKHSSLFQFEARSIGITSTTSFLIIAKLKVFLHTYVSNHLDLSQQEQEIAEQNKIRMRNHLIAKELAKLSKRFIAMRDDDFRQKIKPFISEDIVNHVSKEQIYTYVANAHYQYQSKAYARHIFLAVFMGLEPSMSLEDLSLLHGKMENKFARPTRLMMKAVRIHLQSLDHQKLATESERARHVLNSLIRRLLATEHFHQYNKMIAPIFDIKQNKERSFMASLRELARHYIKEQDYVKLSTLLQILLDDDNFFRVTLGFPLYHHAPSHNTTFSVIEDLVTNTRHLANTAASQGTRDSRHISFTDFDQLYDYQQKTLTKLSEEEQSFAYLYRHKFPRLHSQSLQEQVRDFMSTHQLTDPKQQSILLFYLGLPNHPTLIEFCHLLGLPIADVMKHLRFLAKQWHDNHLVSRMTSSDYQYLERQFNLFTAHHKFFVHPWLDQINQTFFAGHHLDPQKLAMRLRFFYSGLNQPLDRHIFLTFILKLSQPSLQQIDHFTSLYSHSFHKKNKKLVVTNRLNELLEKFIREISHHSENTANTASIDTLIDEGVSASEDDSFTLSSHNTFTLDMLRNWLQIQYEAFINQDFSDEIIERIGLLNDPNLANNQYQTKILHNEKIDFFVSDLMMQDTYLWVVFLTKILNLSDISHAKIWQLFSVETPHQDPALLTTIGNQVEELLLNKFHHFNHQVVAPESQSLIYHHDFRETQPLLWALSTWVNGENKQSLDQFGHLITIRTPFSSMYTALEDLLSYYETNGSSNSLLLFYSYLFYELQPSDFPALLKGLNQEELASQLQHNEEHFQQQLDLVKNDIESMIFYLPPRYTSLDELIHDQNNALVRIDNEQKYIDLGLKLLGERPTESHLTSKINQFLTNLPDHNHFTHTESQVLLLAALKVPPIQQTVLAQLMGRSKNEIEKQTNYMMDLWLKTYGLRSVLPEDFTTINERFNRLSSHDLTLLKPNFYPSLQNNQVIHKELFLNMQLHSTSLWHLFLSWGLGLAQPSMTSGKNITLTHQDRVAGDLRTGWLSPLKYQWWQIISDSVAVSSNIQVPNVQVEETRFKKTTRTSDSKEFFYSQLMYQGEALMSSTLLRMTRKLNYPVLKSAWPYFEHRMILFLNQLRVHDKASWKSFLTDELNLTIIHEGSPTYFSSHPSQSERLAPKNWLAKNIKKLKEQLFTFTSNRPFPSNTARKESLSIVLRELWRDNTAKKAYISRFSDTLNSSLLDDEILTLTEVCADRIIGSKQQFFLFMAHLLDLTPQLSKKQAWELVRLRTNLRQTQHADHLQGIFAGCLASLALSPTSLEADPTANMKFYHQGDKQLYTNLYYNWYYLENNHLKDILRSLSYDEKQPLLSRKQIHNINKDDVELFIKDMTPVWRVVFWALVLHLDGRSIVDLANTYLLSEYDLLKLREHIKKNFIAHVNSIPSE
ncbi:MAG: hypothetical protein OXC40_00340 [Proteobacteria bacterium]|nr:hypothetical protein [Pseudomonadota bacterium]